MARRRRPNRAPAVSRERALNDIYAEMPAIPDCDGSCAEACGPIAMFKGEWERVKRAHGRTPRLPPGSLTCPMLSPTGKCTVYTVRPFICRLWGSVEALRCPRGCEPERWLTTAEARELYLRLREVVGPEITGTLGSIEDLWAGFALEERDSRLALIERIKEAVHDDRSKAGSGGPPIQA